MTEEQSKILSVQTPATQRKLRIQWGCATAEDLAWKPNPEIRAKPNALTDDERVGRRDLTIEETKLYDGPQGLRRNRGQRLAEMHTARYQAIKDKVKNIPKHMVDEPVNSVDEAKRSRAIDAFMFVKAKFLDLMNDWGIKVGSVKEESLIERCRREAGIED